MKALGWIAAAAAGLWIFTRSREYGASEKLGFRLIDFDFPIPKVSGLIANLKALNSLAGRVLVEISNPTATSIRVDSIYGDLLLNGTRIGRVQSLEAINIPGGATSPQTIGATLYGGAFVVAAPGIVAKLAADGSAPVTVTFDGVIRVAGVDLPYTQDATFTLKAGSGR